MLLEPKAGVRAIHKKDRCQYGASPALVAARTVVRGRAAPLRRALVSAAPRRPPSERLHRRHSGARFESACPPFGSRCPTSNGCPGWIGQPRRQHRTSAPSFHCRRTRARTIAALRMYSVSRCFSVTMRSGRCGQGGQGSCSTSLSSLFHARVSRDRGDRPDQPAPPLGSRADHIPDQALTTGLTTRIVRAKLLIPRGAGSGGGRRRPDRGQP